MKLAEILGYFENVKKIRSNQYMVKCPCHDDENNSLSIGLSKDGNCTLLHCFAGCEAKEILRKAGLTMKDLYVNEKNGNSQISNTTEYVYYAENGEIAYKKVRRDSSDGTKSFCFMTPDGKKGLNGVPHELYNLMGIQNSDCIFVVEGEKCADAVIKEGYTATTLDCGANSKWNSRYNKYLKNKKVIILADNDQPGFMYAKMVKDHIHQAKVILLPELPEKGDVYDWLKSGHMMNEVFDLPEFDVDKYCDELDQTGENDKNTNNKTKKTQAEILLEIAEDNINSLFYDDLKNYYAAISVNGHQEIYDLKTEQFRLWLEKLYFDHKQMVIKKENLSQTIELLCAKARFENDEEIKLNIRVAKTEDTIWYDLSNHRWQAVKITSSGWTVENNPPILFHRYKHQEEQGLPSTKGDINKILKYINLQKSQTLFLCWMVCEFIPGYPHPVLILHGEKGAAKTTAFALLKQIIDPSAVETLSMPKNEKDLFTSLQQHWFLPYDNISYLSDTTSDNLCRAITGTAIQFRALYTDADVYIFKFIRCLALNGINNVATKSDLLDRSILIELSRISEENRKEMSSLMKEFENDLPIILGGIFDLLSKAMKIYPSVKLDILPRMADFARWGYAVGEAMGGLGQKFLDEYEENHEIRNKEALNSDIVSSLLVSFMENLEEWNGRVSDLLKALKVHADEVNIKTNCKDFPRQPNMLSKKLKELQSNLQTEGITFETKEKSQGTFLCIKNKNASPLPPYYVSPKKNDVMMDKNEEDSSLDDNEDDVIF